MVSNDKTKDIALIENLSDAGCDKEEIACFMELNRQGNRNAQ